MKTFCCLLLGLVTNFTYAKSLETHIREYRDCLNRVTIFPADHEKCLNQDYDSNNAILWSGEMALLMKESYGSVPEDYRKNIVTSIKNHFSKPGLLSRHPDPYRFSPTMKPISFDEYHGVAFLAAVIPEFRETMDEVVEYGEKNHWQFWDIPGQEQGKPLWSLLTIQNLKDFYAYLQEENLRKATLKYPAWSALFATHHIHQRALYKMFSTKYKPSLFEELYFTATAYFAKDKDNYSSLAMWIFRFKALDEINYNSKPIAWVKKLYLSRLEERFGANYESVVFEQFYIDTNHPFHRLAAMPEIKRIANVKAPKDK